MPLIVFHGGADTLVAPVNAERLVAVRVAAAGAGCSTPVSVRLAEPGRRPCMWAVVRDEDDGVVAESWLVHGSGHAWSGGALAGSCTDPHDPDGGSVRWPIASAST